MDDSRRIDELGREAIINELDKNLFVIAGAGSGKTSMLVSRMVMMVESGIDISKICAITFTKKAAAEFLERFQTMLKQRSKPPFIEGNKYPGDLPTPNEITAQRCQKALENIDLCFTGTIDSFCNLVLSEYPNNAHIPSSSSVVMEDELLELCKKEYQKIANGEPSTLKDKLDIFNLLFTNGPEVFGKSIYKVMQLSHLDIKYPHPTKPLEEAVQDLADKYESEILHDLDALRSCSADVYDVPQYKESFDKFVREFKILTQKWTIANFKIIKRKLKTVIADLRFNELPPLEFFEFEFMSKNKCYKFVQSEKHKQYMHEVDEINYVYSLDFLCSAAEHIKRELKKQGKLSFDEYLITFKNMVKDDMSKGMNLIKHIRNKHSYYLIDESQDTSPVQTELFIYLSSLNQGHSIESCNPIPGSLFIVGDPKQSIYGFRGADVDSYLDTKELFESVFDAKYHKVVYLTRNFRSSSELCDYFNKQFKQLDNYEEIPEDEHKNPSDSQIKNEVLSGVYSGNDYLSTIKYLVGHKYFYDHKDKVKRLIDYKDIMLLTWSTSKHQDIITKLGKYNIPVFCEGRFDVSDSDIMSVVYAIYSYLSDEEGQFYNLLSSPLFNASIDDLVGICGVNDLPESKAKNLLLEIDSLRSIVNPIILFDTVVAKLKIYDYVNIDNLEYVLFASEKLKEAYNTNLISDIKSAASFLKDYVANPLERCMNLQSVPNAVNLANVHKVKGLEKPVVILVESTFSNNKAEFDFSYQNNEAYIFRTSETKNTKGGTYYDIDSGDIFAREEEIANQKKDEENKRLCYVAVTRARNVLVIPPPSKKTSVWNYIRCDEYQGEIPDIDIDADNEMDYAKPFSYMDAKEFNDQESYWQKSPSKVGHLLSKFDEEEKELETSNIDSKTKGTIIHRLMEILVNSKCAISEEIVIKNILNEFSLSFDSEYRLILKKVYEKMISGGYPQKTGAPNDLVAFIKDAKCYTEVPFSFKEGKAIWQGEIDLLVIKDNCYIIIDYKTNADDENLQEEYKGQLEAYKKALKKTLGVDSVAYLYHIDD